MAKINVEMMVIGLTGGIASGKSTAAKVLAKLGAATLDADKIGHELLKSGTEAWQEIVTTFGRDVLGPDKTIDRKKLAQIVFNDPQAMEQLNGIMHPRMLHIAKERIEQLRQQGAQVVVLEAPLLIEADWFQLVDQIWVTSAPEDAVVRRLCQDVGLTEEQARARIRAQMPIAEKVKYADVAINTDREHAETEAEIVQLWHQLIHERAGQDDESGLEDRIREILSHREKKTISDEELIRAAVLIPLYRKEGEYQILFTKRTDKVMVHKGQISFPGGAQDEDDENLLATALRESFEEIGLWSEDVNVLGELDDEVTLVSNFAVTPFVALIPYPYEFKINPREVQELVEVPLSALLQGKNSGEDIIESEEGPVLSHYYRYGNHIIWGATARMLKRFLDLVFG